MEDICNKIDNYFKISERGSTIVTELRAGVITFLTMAYILAVNAAILTDSNGTCDPGFGGDSKLIKCKEELKIDLIYATAISAGVATLLMGLTANLPLALAPGMGLNAYFTYDVVGAGGFGKVSYENALFATFIEGFIFLGLSVTGIRYKMLNLIPRHIKLSMTAGIGLFLAHIGLQSAEGIGIVVGDGATLVTLGGCDLTKQICDDFGLFCYCDTDDAMEGGTAWLGIAGFLILSVLMVYRVKGAIFFTVMFVTFLSWFRNTDITYFPDTDAGEERYDYFKKIVYAHSFDKTPFALFNDVNLGESDIWVALVVFLYVDMLDTAGTLYSMAEYMDILDENGQFEGQTWAFCSDAIGTIIGALLGTSSVTTYIESSAGIKEGGKTGLTACVVAFFFIISLIFSPLLASIPPWATGPALVIIGSLMMKSVLKIDWENMRIAFPSFVTMILMPLTYSIANGVIAGVFTHLFIVGFDMVIAKIYELMGKSPPQDPSQAIANSQTQGGKSSKDLLQSTKDSNNNTGTNEGTEMATTVGASDPPPAVLSSSTTKEEVEFM